jgi:hypothetical protein
MAYLRGEDSHILLREQQEEDYQVEEARKQAAAADILVHLQRMRNARLLLERNPSAYHATLGDYYRAMGRVIDLLDDFRIEHWIVPDFVMEQWDAERKQELAQRAA